MNAIRPAANTTPANALSRVAPLVSLGLSELEVAESVVDDSGAAVVETVEPDGEAEEVDDAAGVASAVFEVKDEAEDSLLMSMLKEVSPVYDCTVPSPDVVVSISSLEMV